ncbi:SusC/RagA family TonB-linked outer membrane protein [Filimonas effusa]|uniref:SusC/RagA family TonB-linked outer membrane protein n=1 Tax=Filimonas effusa TaxID=2508721 RepID=A0A4Q1D412_9BACT|nr:SusC/RagA family TonB-linked outer membrane protein [Filimonas effusa]RXK83078.1 SusC/RagA family TonB-linked outer membrane protein [Filimonas effusa]
MITWLLSGLLFGQQKIPSRVRVTLDANKITLKEVFNRIKKQTGYNINYGNNYINDKERIAIHVLNKPLQDVMMMLVRERGLEFVIPPDDNAIIIRKSQGIVVAKAAEAPVVETRVIEGVVTDTLNEGLAGTTIQLKGTHRSLATDEAGVFSMPGVPVPSTFVINRVGYQPVEMEWKGEGKLRIQLRELVQRMEDVTVASTGYQQIKRSKSAASYVVVDNNLLNRSISTNILDRLRGVASGVLFDNNSGSDVGITIRGRSTIFGNTTPLIVLDNYPYEGELSDINPNDIESVTILKDAVAAAIWGTRAGNGVIVIQSKKGVLGAKPKVSASSNFTYGVKPDVYYAPQLSSSEYIDVQQFLYKSGAFDGFRDYQAVNPAVQIMMDRSRGLISSADSAQRINALKQYDVRDDLNKYFYQSSFNQQYQVNVRGGTRTQTYYVSGGYDRNVPSNVKNLFERFSLKGNYTLSLLDKRLQISTDLFFTASNSYEQADKYNPAYPFARLADEKGNALPVMVTGTATLPGLKQSYTDTAGGGRLLDWQYRPLDELRNEYRRTKTRINDRRINVTATYRLLPGLSVSGNYQYNKAVSDVGVWSDANSYSVRYQVNTFTQINRSTGVISYPFPKGAILSNTENDLHSHFGRFQANYEKVLFKKHAVNAIAGYEVRSQDRVISRELYNGYDPATGASVPVDFNTFFPYYFNPLQTAKIFNTLAPGSWRADRNRSVYGNFSYVYDSKYLVTGSLRRDESNLFGASANKRGVPLWSAGAGWIVSKSAFYKAGWLPYLKLSASYGYNGNIDNSLSAYLTINTNTVLNSIYGNPTYSIFSPPNPSLSWERVRNINFLIDFSSRNNRISGTIEFYRKNGLDLIGRMPVAQQTGVSAFKGNSANINGSGVDIQLNTINTKGMIRWETNVLFNYNRETVKEYKYPQTGANSVIVSGDYDIDPLPGYPVRSVFSYRFAGLDTAGRPIGYANGKQSTVYTSITGSLDRSDLRFHGTMVPRVFGSMRNTISYHNLSLSFNIIYKLDYYFKRPSVNYYALYSFYGGEYHMADFGNRWQKRGDELTTTVPGMPAYTTGASQSETAFYSNSEVLVEKGDHIRWQDIQLSWALGSRAKTTKWGMKNISVNVYVNNLGVIWRANDKGLDPEALTVPIPKTYSLGFKAEF